MSDEAREGTADVNNLGLSRKHVLEAATPACAEWGSTTSTCTRSTGTIRTRRSKRPLKPSTTWCDAARCCTSAARTWRRGTWSRLFYLARSHSWARFASLQAYYSLAARDLEHELLPTCREGGLDDGVSAGRIPPVVAGQRLFPRDAIGGGGHAGPRGPDHLTNSAGRRSSSRQSCQVPSSPSSYSRMTPTGLKPTFS